MTPNSGHQWQKLHALVAAIDAAAMREPYPRLAQLMQRMAMRQTGPRTARERPTYG